MHRYMVPEQCQLMHHMFGKLASGCCWEGDASREATNRNRNKTTKRSMPGCVDAVDFCGSLSQGDDQMGLNFRTQVRRPQETGVICFVCHRWAIDSLDGRHVTASCYWRWNFTEITLVLWSCTAKYKCTWYVSSMEYWRLDLYFLLKAIKLCFINVNELETVPYHFHIHKVNLEE